MPISISPTIASVNINGNTYDHVNWENNTPGTISGIANDISTQITLLELVGVLTKAIGGNVTLTGPESTNIGFVFTGALGANANITFAAGFEGIAQIENQTTGGFSLVCGLVAGSTVTVPPAGSAAAFCDGNNFSLQSGVVRTSAGAKVTGAFETTGAATVGGAFSVVGATNLGVVTVGGALSANSAATFTDTINVVGAGTVGGALSIGGALTGLTGNFSAAATVGGAFSVTGAANLADTLNVGGNTTVSGAYFRHINTSGETRNVISTPAGEAGWTEYQTAGVTRWIVGKNITAETGSDAGSDYAIGAYSDIGVGIIAPLVIKRANGNIIMALPTSSAGLASGTLWNDVGTVKIV